MICIFVETKAKKMKNQSSTNQPMYVVWKIYEREARMATGLKNEIVSDPMTFDQAMEYANGLNWQSIDELTKEYTVRAY